MQSEFSIGSPMNGYVNFKPKKKNALSKMSLPKNVSVQKKYKCLDDD